MQRGEKRRRHETVDEQQPIPHANHTAYTTNLKRGPEDSDTGMREKSFERRMRARHEDNNLPQSSNTRTLYGNPLSMCKNENKRLRLEIENMKQEMGTLMQTWETRIRREVQRRVALEIKQMVRNNNNNARGMDIELRRLHNSLLQ